MLKALALFTFFLFGMAALGAPEPQVHREDLFRRAFRSTGFVMMNAYHEPSFMKSLSKNEQLWFSEILLAAHFAEQRTWMLELGAHNFGSPGNESFAWVMTDGNQGVIASFNVTADLEFSDDEKKFQLKPGEVARTAITNELDPKGKIFINRTLISKPEFSVNFAGAISLAVHEIGNKFGRTRDQAAIDSVAGKVQKYVEQNTQSFETSRGNLSITTFKNYRFEDLLQKTLARSQSGPNRFDPKIWISHNQGLYAFFESKNAVIDVSKELTATFEKDRSEEISKMPFDWLNLITYAGEDAKVTMLNESQLNIEMNMTKFRASIPFGTPSSPEPTLFKPWAKLKDVSSYRHIDRTRVSWTVDISSDKLTVKAGRRRDQVVEDPSVKVEKISSVASSDEHILTYKIPSYYKIQGHLTGSEVQPFLKVKHSGELLEIRGFKKTGIEDHFDFHIPNPGDGSPVEVLGLELTGGPNTPHMTSLQLIRIKFLLPEQETIVFPESGNKARAGSFDLKAVQIWDGKKWRALKNGVNGNAGREKVLRGSHLRFIFDSTTELLSLGITQSFKNQTHILTEAEPLPSFQIQTLDPIQDRVVDIPVEKLKQSRLGNKLIVEWLVDKDFELKTTVQVAMDPKAHIELLQTTGRLFYYSHVPDRATQKITNEVVGPRIVSAVGAMNARLQTTSYDLTKPAVFDKLPPTSPAPPDVFTRLTCEKLFP